LNREYQLETDYEGAGISEKTLPKLQADPAQGSRSSHMFRPAAQAKAGVNADITARVRDIGKRWIIRAVLALRPGSRAPDVEAFDRKALIG